MSAHKHRAVHIQGHNSRTKIQFIRDVTLCFWVCSFQNLDLYPEDEGSTILRNVGNCSPNDTESHFRRLNLQQHLRCRISVHCAPCFFYCSRSYYCSMERQRIEPLQLSKCQRSTQQLMTLYTLYTLSPTYGIWQIQLGNIYELT